VILRSDTHPTYHLSVVVDDIDMAITHVVRGDDHISNTPKQVLLYNAFGKPAPAFAHVPLIMGPDKQRLSKRHGATSVTEYEKQGYIPKRCSTFSPARLGHGQQRRAVHARRTDPAIQSRGISGGNAVFNTEKLDWFNHQHLLRLTMKS
jgi:glutamyl-tRNA synthetase